MTGPNGPSSGEIRLEAHVDTSSVPRELKEGTEVAAAAAEKDLRTKGGPQLGDAVADGMGKELESRGRDLASSIERGLGKGKIRVKTVDFERDASGKIIRQITQSFEQAFAQAGDEVIKPGGPINKIGDALRDAVGAGFNISGKSPLIGALIPVFGAIGTAILGIIQAANSLIAVLTVIPAAIAAIGIQVGVLAIAFQGLSGAVGGALNAKNVKEFEAAIKDLSPAAKEFVRTLVPALQDFGRQLGKRVQDAFFIGLGPDIIPQTLATLQQFIPDLATVAVNLGMLVHNVVAAFNSPVFVAFIKALLPLIDEWISEIGPQLYAFIQSLSAFAFTTLPFFQKLGAGFASFLGKVNKTLEDLAHNNDFKQWLMDMLPVLKQTGELIAAAFQLIVTLVAQLNANGGPGVLQFLIRVINTISDFLRTPIGAEAFAGLIDVLKFLTILFIGLVAAVTLVLAAIELVKQAIEGLGILWGKIVEGIKGKLGEWRDAVLNWFFELGKWFGELPDKVVNWIGDVKDKLFQKGHDLVDGFIRGIKSQYEATKAAAFGILDAVTRLLPGSPAKEGPLSGQGYVYLRGQRMVKDFARGIESVTPNAMSATNSMVSSNIVFGPNAIRVSYEGVQPTPDEARMTGSAIGQGVLGQLSARNDALAVRTL